MTAIDEPQEGSVSITDRGHTQSEVSLQCRSFSHQTHVMPSEQEARLINSEVGVPCEQGLIQATNIVSGISGLT